MKIPEEKLAKAGKLFRQQIIYISQRGCNGIKCKECCLMNMCTREPLKSKVLAMSILEQALKDIKTRKEQCPQ